MTYENKIYKVEVNEGKVTITNKYFDDTYTCRMVDGKLRAGTSLALAQGNKVRKIFNF